MREFGIEKNRRWALRSWMDLDVDVTDSAGLAYVATVTDISEDGCAIRISPDCKLVHDRIHTIKATGFGPLAAYVIWSSENNAGLAFCEPCNPAIIQSIKAES